MSILYPHRKSRDTGNLLQRLRLFLTVAGLVALLTAVKFLVNRVGLEFLTLNALFTSAIGGAIFIVGFLLASLLSDYKESERQPAELRVALEALHDDITSYVRNGGIADLAGLRILLGNIVRSLLNGLSIDAKSGDLRLTLLRA